MKGKILICKQLDGVLKTTGKTSLGPSSSVRNGKIRSKHEITQKIDVYRKQAVPMVAGSGDRRDEKCCITLIGCIKI